MKQKTINKQAAKRLKRNIGKAISLLGIALFVNLSVILVNHVFNVVFDTTFFNENLKIDWSTPSLLATLCSLILSFLVFMPFSVNVKSWYLSLANENAPINEAFSYFGEIKIYLHAVWYCLIKTVIQIGIGFCLLIPAMAMAIAIKIQSNQTEQTGILFAMLLFAMCVFVILAIFYAVYIALGFFFADYIFVTKIAKNPFQIFKVSMQIAKRQRHRLLLLFLSLLPYLLLCVFIIPLIVLIPYIKACLAFYADEAIKQYQAQADANKSESKSIAF